jgi:hypothetical protein
MRRARQAVLVTLLGLGLLLPHPLPAYGKAELGKAAPFFDLKAYTGERVTQRSLLGKAAVLVVGRTEKAAPPCKEWALRLIKHYGDKAHVYQVIVLKTSWYIPRSLVLKRVRGFIPGDFLGRVLLEWYTVFADTWGVPMHDDPTIFGLDPKGVVRFIRRGRMEKKALSDLLATLAPFTIRQ